MTTASDTRPPPPARAWQPPDPSRLGIPRLVAVVLLGLAAVALATVRYLGNDPRLSGGTERVLQAAAFAAIAFAPGALALMSTRRRSVLLVAAAVALTPLTLLSLAGALLPLVVPVVLLWLAFATRYDGAPCGAARAALAVVVVVVLLGGAVVVLFAHQDPRSYGGSHVIVRGSSVSSWGVGSVGSGGGGATSDVVTTSESVASLALVGLALTSGWILAAPRAARRAALRGRAGR